MEGLDVVTNSHAWGDETQWIEIPEEEDIQEIANRVVRPVKDDIRKARQDLKEAQSDLSSLRQDYDDTKKAHSSELQTLQKSIQQKEEALRSSFDTRMNAFNNSFKEKGKELSTEFIQQCRADVKGYFETLAQYATEIKKEADELQKTRQIIEEQLKMSASIANYLMELYNKTEAARKSGLLARNEYPSSQMKEAPAQTQAQTSPQAQVTAQEQASASNSSDDGIFKKIWRRILNSFG